MSGSDLLGGPPPVDPGNQATFGVHLQYIASEVHSTRNKLDQLGERMGDMITEMAKMGTTYASNNALGEVIKRVDQLEAQRDRDSGTAPTYVEMARTVNRLELTLERMRGGYQWLWAAYGILVGLIGLGLAAAKLWLS